MAEFIKQSEFSSTTDRTKRRTMFLNFMDNNFRIWIREYYVNYPDGDQITLYILSKIGKERIVEFESETNRTFDELKRCIGLRIPMIIAEMVGESNTESFRNPSTYKNSTRSVSVDWNEISSWVKSYTPHRITEAGKKILGNIE